MRSPQVVAARRSLADAPSARLARLEPARQLSGEALLHTAARYVEQGLVARATPLLPRIESVDDRRALAAAVALARRGRAAAERALAGVLERSPNHERARALALRIEQRFGLAPPLAAALRAGESGPSERAVTAASAAAAAEDWAALAALDADLASVPAESPFHLDARVLRAAWRAHAPDAALRDEAHALLAGVIVTSPGATSARLLLAQLDRDDPVRLAVPLLRIATDPATLPLTAREAERMRALARDIPAARADLAGARARILAFLESAPRVPPRP
jgi:hypothetical protein